jgi:hypothetical protein
MIELGDGLRFALEAPRIFAVASEGCVNNLNRRPAVEAHIQSPVDTCHVTAP